MDRLRKIYLFFIAVFTAAAVYLLLFVSKQAVNNEVSPGEDFLYFAGAAFFCVAVFYMIVDFLLLWNLRGWKKAAAVALCVFLMLTGMEMSLRYFEYLYPPVYRRSPALLWEVSPNLTGAPDNDDSYRINTNSLGLRCAEVSPRKAADEFRIFIIGDSTAFGWLLDEKNIFPYILERNLRMKAKGRNIRVINGAVCGYSSLQGLEFLNEKGWSLSPDLIITAFNNDPVADYVEDEKRMPSRRMLPMLNFFNRFRVYALVRDLIFRSRINPEDDVSIPPGKGTARVSRQKFTEIYETLTAEAKSRGIELMFVSLPLKEEMRRYPGMNDYREILNSTARKNKIPLLDEYHKWQGSDWENLFMDGMHPTSQGHGIIAGDIEEIINQNNLLKK
jgi:lysophospholipase L1-like esterase